MCLAGRRHLGIGRAHIGVADLPGNAHGSREVRCADHQAIHARHGGDGIGIRDRFRRLDHDRHHDLFVQFFLRGGGVGNLEGVLRRRAAPGTLTQRRVAEGAHHIAGFIRVINMRHHHAHGAIIQAARAFKQRILAAANNRCNALRKCRHGHARRVIHAHGAMFHINEQPIKARRSGNHADSRRAQMMHAKAKGEFTLFQAATCEVRSDRHGVSPQELLCVAI